MGKKADNNEMEKITWKEAFRIHYRGCQDIRRYCPGVFTVFALHAAAGALAPYITIYLSARIINELAGMRRTDVLLRLVLAALISSAALTLLTGVLLRLKEFMNCKWEAGMERIFTDKMLSMDFADVDRAESRDLLSQIRQNGWFGGWGIGALLPLFSELTEGALGILGAAILTGSLFFLPVPEEAGKLTVLNHPIFLLAFVAVMALVTALGSACSNKAMRYQTTFTEEGKFYNRIFNAFGFLVWDRSRAMDIRMYEQQKIGRHFLRAEGHSGFGTGGRLAAYARGPMGAWAALGAAISSVMTGLVYVFVCLKAWAGAFGVGSVTQYVGAVTAMAQNSSLLIRTLGALKSNTPFMRTVYEFLDIPNGMYQGSLTTEKRADREYEVEFRDVSFRYPGADVWALRHVNMKFKVGQRMAVVGENGSGKTTFIKLLCRLYDPQEGQILLNGIDIRKYDYRDYMDVFAVVFQDFQLLAQPLGANVAGASVYEEESVRKTLTDAGFDERLGTMPEGLDTMLYKEFVKDGVEVSGGEAQKIAIARALYRDAPFIILDEPTAALDPVAEAEIYSKFNDIVGDKTAIYISHRLSSCKFCDEIVVFHKGEVIQQGTHEGLLKDERGKYCELWNAQAQYYAVN